MQAIISRDTHIATQIQTIEFDENKKTGVFCLLPFIKYNITETIINFI